MKTLNITDKKQYTTPTVQCVILDHEISLHLESTPPLGPDESNLKMPENQKNSPFIA